MKEEENCYKPVFNHNHRQAFQDYINALGIKNLDYFAIGFQDPIHQKSFALMSNVDWQKTFKAQEFAPYDPIRKAAFGSSRRFFTFDQINCCDNLGKEIMRQRKKHGISQGLVIMDRHLGHNYMLTLATDYTRFDAFDFYMRHTESLMLILDDLKKIIQPEVKNYIIT